MKTKKRKHMRTKFAICILVVFVSLTACSPGDKSYDVVIYGGTASGIIAGVAAAREGASVMIVAPEKFIGGMVSGGLARTDKGKEQVIGGITREYFKRASARYNGEFMWYAEPHVNLEIFKEMIAEANIEIITGERLRDVRKEGNHITGITTLSGKEYTAPVFIDASYEGDLMAMAGVNYIVGRESTGTFGEEYAGVVRNEVRNFSQEIMTQGCPCVGDKGPHFVHGAPMKISALDPDGDLIAGVVRSAAVEGSADKLTQSYNFRLSVTQNKDNMVPWPEPENYDPSDYELLLRLINSYPGIPFSRLVHLGTIANEKYDLNAQGLFSTDYVGGNTAYPDGDYETRDKIWKDHVDYTKGYFWFLSHDERVPEKLRREVNSWGLCKDEFTDNDNWPYQLYIREARRMIGPYIMVQSDVQEDIYKDDAIAMGSFIIDSHIVQRLAADDGTVIDEGAFDVSTKPYQIPYRVLTPKKAECDNLLVTVCVSASHIAYGSIRMEPVYMELGHAAGLAAFAASGAGVSVQDIEVSGLQEKLKEQGQILSVE